MGFQLKEDEYYIVKQIIENEKTLINEFYGVNEESIIKFTRIMAGTVVVYIYNKRNNERKDKTKELGREPRKLDEFRNIIKVKALFYDEEKDYKMRQENYRNLFIYQDIIKDIISQSSDNKAFYFIEKFAKIHYRYNILKSLLTTHYYNSETKIKEIEEHKKTSGTDYEKFIGAKYEKLNKNVIYNGINKDKKDNGIDLIINENNKITFVQCKNWIGKEYYKISQKDIRAFIGDCFMYIIKNNITKKYNLHFIVSDTELLTKSAELYIKQQNILKFKIIPFER